MDIEKFKEQHKSLKDVDKVNVDDLCDHPEHINLGKKIGKGPAKRNILKHDGKEFICRECYMKHDNPMLHVGERRQTDEVITVYCPHPEHSGDPDREMKKSCYYGSMEEPYLQVCRSCSQLGRVISGEQREKIRISLTGIKRSDEFRQKLSDYMKGNQEGIDRAFSNLIPGSGGGWNKGLNLPEETKQKMSESHSGKKFTKEHRKNISKGRKKMLKETGGFTREHREKLSRATRRNYEKGFDPNKYHYKGWHESPKAGEVFYRSSYEKRAYQLLDRDEDVVTYYPESVRITYYNPQKDINATYLVDIKVVYKNEITKLIEVKPQAWLSDDVIIAKHDTADIYANENNMKFEVWTEVELFGPIYDERKIRTFTENLENPERKSNRKKLNRKKAKKHYHKHIANDKVEVFCEYCNKTHTPLRLTYEKNIKRNGEYICERHGGYLAGKKPGKKKINPYASDGKKKCNRCKEVKLFEEFGDDKSKSDGKSTRCKKCRTEVAMAKYNEGKSKTT